MFNTRPLITALLSSFLFTGCIEIIAEPGDMILFSALTYHCGLNSEVDV